MEPNVHLTTWISRASKARFAAVARAQGLSESALLRRLVESVMLTTSAVGERALEQPEPVARTGRISIRLRRDDLLLLQDRAATRQLPMSTYVSYLVRAHFLGQAPLPTAELEALRRSVAEVGAIGRNLNQIARAVNQQQWPGAPNKSELLLTIKAIAEMRDHFKALINANLASWDGGNAKKNG